MRRSLCAGIAVALTGCSGVGGANYDVQDAADGAAFRLEAREIVGRLNPVCDYTADATQLARYDAPRARYRKLKEWVADTPFIVDLAVIEADYKQYWAANVAECGPIDTEETRQIMDAEMNAIDARLSNLEKMAGVV